VIDSLVQDLRYALRGLRRSPGFAAAAILTLALAIGANASTFSLIRGILLRPLPFADVEHLVTVTGLHQHEFRATPGMLYDVSPRDLSIFISMPVLLVTVVFIATYLPARRAMRVDPVISLRSE
jgi:ABC-type antimicrobial peptide transport system permease subunit